MQLNWCRESVMRGELLSWTAFDCTRHGNSRRRSSRRNELEEGGELEVQKESPGGRWRAGRQRAEEGGEMDDKDPGEELIR